MPALFGLALIGAFCLLGMAIRRWIPAFRTNMVPAFVIAGFLGMIAMNVGLDGLVPGVDTGLFTTITAQMFTLSFISIGLTTAPPRASDGSGRGGGLLRGAWTMGLTWTLVFALQALLGIGLVAVAGPAVGMDPVYGLMLPFAFAQGPGQAVTFAGIFETQGWTDATAVGLAFAAAGFIAAFGLGVPLARWGMRRGLATHAVPISDSVAKGFYREGEETDSMGSETSYPGNVDTLTVHVALMGIAYVLAHGLAWVLSFIPGFFGDTISGMMFMNGLLAAYFVRWVMRRARIEHLIDRRLQTKITGFATDYVVVASFLAVQLAVVVQWLFPILLTILVATVVTAAATVLIGQRYGSDHDFERTLGMYGTLTGTTPTGLALVRIVDPRSRTTTMAEMGLMNLPEMLYLPAMLTISAAFAGTYGLGAAVGILAALTVGYAVIMLVTRSVGRRRSWTLRGDAVASTDGAEAAVPVAD